MTVRSVYNVIDLLYYILKMYGLAPYTRRKNQGGSYVYVQCKPSRKYLFSILGFVVSLLGLGMVIFQVNQEQEMDTLEKTLYVGIIVQLVFNSAIIRVTFARKIGQFFETLEILNLIDKTLSQIGVQISYKFIQKFSSVFVAIYILHPIFTCVHIYDQRDTLLTFGEYFGFGVPLLTFQISLIIFLIYSVTLWNRFALINQQISQLNSHNFTKIFVKRRIVLFSDLHQRLCKATLFLTECLSPGLLTMYLQFLQMFTILMLIVLNVGLPSYKADAMTWTLLITGENLAMAIIIELIIYESEKTFRVLIDLENYHRDRNTELKVNTFLLQMLHQKISFTLGGLFEFNLNKLLQSVGTVTNFVMFVLQIKHN
ncbi:gustatory receptor Gr109 [Tribolium castaneum]|uniref:Gustatory receptor n=1 Tax=Tribolium castaneum TaxID=7070 RepID=B8PUQ4_TRICA|nr:gustatory receptor Gr109 [Tribolium castaneum]XP_008201069.1 PREDICTED: uncharacterized protein LOC103315077 [Tribolium castaneum]ABY40625.1 gustatory receptor [Tribolium castaneum]EEZ99388.1 gustatory receptor 159 [Tribolium castaneum]|eukprot:XP_008201069.1 PREDICTED: uncharacterized protein LOC103315077 [Tribolium castaneum]